jgi:hypothetical protein
MEIEIISALQKVKDKYGIELATTVEQIFRNETKHFKSGGFASTFSAGMESFSDKQPYGWSVVKKFWENNPSYAPIGIVEQKENNSAMLDSRGVRKFIKFPTIEASIMTVAYIINSRGGDGGSWFSIKDMPTRTRYNSYLKTIKARFVKQLN